MTTKKPYKQYIWKELSTDGLLKTPEKDGPYYEERELNGYHGYFTSEDDAIMALNDWKRQGDYVLTTIYKNY